MQKKYEQVSEFILRLIQDGAIGVGEKIPSVRTTAEQMQFSMMTVLDAYRRLEADGIIESIPRSGYRVLSLSGKHRRQPPEAETEHIRIKTAAVTIHAQTEELLRTVGQAHVIPLGAGLPEPADMPSEELSRCVARAARSAPEAVNQYEFGAGDPGLRKQIARHMADFGCPQNPDDMLITSGITQGLILALRAITHPGDLIAVESPGYYGFFTALNFLHLHAVEIPSSPNTGVDLSSFSRLIENGTVPKALIVAPTFANPTGAVMPDPSRQKLVALAKKHGIILIEDDTYGNLSYSDQRPFPLKALAPDSIIYLGSFSKTVAPGYRIAWVAGGRYMDDIQRCHAMSVLSLPRITQQALKMYLEKGGINRHLRRLRQKYKTNVYRMQEAVAEHFPEKTKSSHPDGGHFLWVRLPGKTDSVLLAKEALKKRISIAPGPLFSSRSHYRHYLRLNCALNWTDEVDAALLTLGKLARRLAK